tara:strand:- start:3181 stop:4020 length:840 start_codon:yes stop_codon:yes gene_type:complete
MVLKSYAKINLNLIVNKKLANGLHNIQSVYCLVDSFDTISIKKNKTIKKDKILILGAHAKYISPSNNSVSKLLKLMRKYKLISDYYSIKITKRIPVYAGLAGGTSNAATILTFLLKKKINRKIFDKIIYQIGSDLRLFAYNQGYLKNLKTVIKFNKKYKFYFILAHPLIKCSTEKIFSKVKKFSKKEIFLNRKFNTRNQFIEYLAGSKNDLQSIVEKRYPIIKNLLINISETKGCYFSRITGSGSTCYGLFVNEYCVKVALKKLRKKHPKFLFSIAKTI